jgi:hypothetical protein
VVFKDVLDQIPSSELSVLAVWMPCMAMDNAKAALSAESLLPDSRVVHFWDGEKALGTLYARMLPLPRGTTLAWDIYFLYAPGVEWGEQPPMPTEWMHQLGEGTRSLNGQKLRESVVDLLPAQETAELVSER